METGETTVKCNDRDEFMANVKKGLVEFVTETVDAPEIYGVVCLVNLGEHTQIYTSGNKPALANLKQHMIRVGASGRRVFSLNTIGLAVVLFGVGVLVGMVV